MLFPNTGGWSVTHEYAEPGTRCLSYEEGANEIAMNQLPLTPDQMRTLAEQLYREADTMEAKHEGAE